VNILRSFSDLIFPRTCELCGRPADRPDRQLCAACLMRLPFCEQEGACRICGRPVASPGPELTCGDCVGPNRPAFDRAASALRFEGDARRMLLDFKFNRHFWLRDDFVDWLEASARARFDVAAIDCVMPVPTTLFHRIDRGYFPVGCLAGQLAKRLERRYLPKALFRCGDPVRQSSLTEDERRENVRDTVGVRYAELIRGRTVLVVDDILTTGETLSECARQLKLAGAWRVWCLTLARAVRD